ncbi:hypothetical protein GCK72_004875 [Caenorhabditis remanei]|uniref:Uncharacterized protein n=1 Tax=Caenorhabditis remanei TaxID=31234 RepID=A0A6A5HDI9_CAERE|nr:hypothetical protein GCK72_004875 [Caenorhabditis remanei]KAF1764924.1 hypothetical protein GCK72_004875 [Caenorhabditis remanei]
MNLQFDELETNGEYVAVESGPFVNVPYGQSRFTLRGKRYNPIIRAPQLIPTFLNSAESMDIYLKKEGYGTITGLPYPFDGILSRSPSASNIQIKHLQSHIPPLKIGGSMEHLNELGTASWLGKNEKWMMGERVKVETQMTGAAQKQEEHIPRLEIKDTDGGSTTASEVVRKEGRGDKGGSSTKLPRLLNSNRSFKRNSNQKPTSEDTRPPPENLPPIDQKPISQNNIQQQLPLQKDNDTISIKTEEEVISILKPEKTTTESVITSKISRKNAPKDDDEVRFHRSYQVTQTTYTTRNSDENKEGVQAEMMEKPQQQQPQKPSENSEVYEKPPPPKPAPKNQSRPSEKPEKPEKKERAKWSESSLKREKSMDNLKKMKKEKSVDKLDRMENSEKNEVSRKSEMGNKEEKTKGNLKKFDVDINEIPIRYEGAGGGGRSNIGVRSESKIVTSRSTMHLFIDDLVGEDELDDVIERAQLWDMNRRRQKMRQQCTQTSGSIYRSISAPRRRVVLFDPDFD